MQQPNASSGFLAGMTGLFSGKVLTRQKIIDAIRKDLKMGFLSTRSNEFVDDIIIPYLENTQNEPEHLAKILKAVLNVIYLQCDPDSSYVNTHDYMWYKDKLNIPYYPDVKILRDTWDKRYKQWYDLVKPYNTDGIHSKRSTNTDYQSFEECLLSAIPADGTVLFPNARVLTHLQALVRQYNVFENRLIEDTANNRELKALSPYR